MAFTISADEIKKTLTGYDPAKSEDFHAQSAKLADAAYAQALRERPEKTVILMSGGSASGKSEYVSAVLQGLDAIIFDGTLPTLEGAHAKIKRAQKAGKQPQIYSVWPKNFVTAFVAFLNRERQFSPSHFYRTHSNARKTLLEVATLYPSIPIRIIESDYIDPMILGTGGEDNAGMRFSDLEFSDSEELIAFLGQNQYTEAEISNKVLRP